MTFLRRIGNHTLGAEILWNDERELYLARFFLPRGYRVNVFFGEDPDPDPHDHPWDFWTFPLASYVEEVWEVEPETATETREGKLLGRRECRRQIVPAFRRHLRGHGHIHRVMHRHRRGIFLDCIHVTIMRVKGPTHQWGFWPRLRGVRGVSFVPWRDYKHGDCGCLSSAISAPHLAGE